MPDTKSGIKHLSNVASMHQNLLISLQRLYSKQFKSVMKTYTKEISYIKEDLTKLQSDRDRFLKEDEMHKKEMNLSVSDISSLDSPPITRSDAFEQLKQWNREHNNTINDKVRQFSNSSGRWAQTELQPDGNLQANKQNIIQMEPQNSQTSQVVSSWASGKSVVKPGLEKRTKSAQKITLLEEVHEEDEGELQIEKDKTKRPASRNTRTPIQVPVVTVAVVPSFQNDRFVNSVVNNARAKLASLYQQSVLGPLSHTKPVLLNNQMRNKKARSQSAAVTRPKTAIQRATVPVRPATTQTGRIKGRRERASGRENENPSAFENEESEAEKNYRLRQLRLEEIKQGLGERYLRFEEALHRRMMIREMKAAEYDVNHGKDGGSSLQDLLPTRKSAMSSALRRQSALIALERSFLGGPVGSLG